MTALSEYRKNQKRLIDTAPTGVTQPPRVSIKDNRFALIDPAGARTEVPFLKDGPALDVVFIDQNEKTSKLYWGKGYDGTNPNPGPPVCFSDNGVAPSSNALEPQNPTCQGCPHNVWGSAISGQGKEIKACSDLNKLAVVVVGFQGVYMFAITGGSFKNWRNYLNDLRMKKLPDGGRPDLSDIVTRVRFASQGVLSFEPVALVTDDSPLAPQIIEIWERNKTTDITGMMVGRYDQPWQGVLAASEEGKTLPAPLPPAPSLFQEQPALASSLAAQPEAKEPKPGRPAKKKEEQPAPIEPRMPAQHGIQTPQAAPADISTRLDTLFKLPPVKPA